MDSDKLIVVSLVLSRLDYCNSLLASAPRYQIDQLQRVLNAAARLVLRVDRSTTQLRPLVRDSLHWLRIPQRIDYKLCTLVYKSLQGLAPFYLSELYIPVSATEHSSHIRSAVKGDLVSPRHSLSTNCLRAFSIAGPQIWNSLPVAIHD